MQQVVTQNFHRGAPSLKDLTFMPNTPVMKVSGKKMWASNGKSTDGVLFLEASSRLHDTQLGRHQSSFSVLQVKHLAEDLVLFHDLGNLVFRTNSACSVVVSGSMA